MIETVIEVPELAPEQKPESQLVEIEFWYFNNSRPLKTEVSCTDYFKLLSTGLLDGRQVSAVKIFSVSEDDLGTCTFMYSFAKQKQGETPWIMS